MTVAQGGSKWTQVFIPGVPSKPIVDNSGFVGTVIALESEPFIQVTTEPLKQYADPRVGLLQTTGAWNHIDYNGLVAQLLVHRHVVELSIHRCDYKYRHGGYDKLTIVSHQLQTTLVPKVKAVPVKPSGLKKTVPAKPSSFASRFKSIGHIVECEDRREQRQERQHQGPRPTRPPTNGKKKKTKQAELLEDVVGDMLDLPAGALSSIFQGEEDIVEAEDAQSQLPSADQDEHAQHAANSSEETDDEVQDMGGSIMHKTIDSICSQHNMTVNEILVPSHHWSIVRDGYEIGQVRPLTCGDDVQTLKGLCRLKHKPFCVKNCGCFLNCRNDFGSAFCGLVG